MSEKLFKEEEIENAKERGELVDDESSSSSTHSIEYDTEPIDHEEIPGELFSSDEIESGMDTEDRIGKLISRYKKQIGKLGEDYVSEYSDFDSAEAFIESVDWEFDIEDFEEYKNELENRLEQKISIDFQRFIIEEWGKSLREDMNEFFENN